VTARADAASALRVIPVVVLEIDRDGCGNTYGVAPCTAAAGSGRECYYSYATCQDTANFAKVTVTDKFCSRSMPAPAGELIRPYVLDLNATPTEINPAKGLAQRGSTTVTLTDEPCPDYLDDRHAGGRPVEAGGTYFGRYLARHKYLAGRYARVRTGYLTDPWDWSTFVSELYVITGATGPDARGQVRLVLQDPTKLLDTAKIPATTDGKLATELLAVAHTGVVQSATSTTVVLAASASAVDDTYNGMEVWIYADQGAGQRRTITDYVGATRTATVAAWSVEPNSTSSYEVGALSLTLFSGKAAQYPDPATTGRDEFVRIGKEIIRYTAKTGDVFIWPDTTYRAAFGSTREDHKQNDQVQTCVAYIDQSADAVLQDLHERGGIATANLDLTGWADEVSDCLIDARITDCLSAPESASALVADLAIDLACGLWWDSVAQQVKLRADMPTLLSSIGELTDDDLVEDSVKVDPQDKDVITRQSLYYGVIDAAGDRKQAPNYQRGTMTIDAAAEGANERNREIPAVRMSHWLPTTAEVHANAWTDRRVRRLRDTPVRIGFRLMPRSEVTLGDLKYLTTKQWVGADGQPARTLVRIVRTEWVNGEQDVIATTTGFGTGRHAFIAPNGGTDDYADATDDERVYAYICDSAGLMSDGSDGYTIS
jgi:hypothetical protein